MRGALMLTIDVNHPDVLEFAKVKEDLTKVTGANISIKLNKEFMKAVENDEDYLLRWPCDFKYEREYPLTFEYDKLTEVKHPDNIITYVKRIKAKEYFDEFIKQAHNNAEPGLLMWDNVIDYGPDGVYDEYRPQGTNPCGEITLQPYDSCRLMCLNLFSFVDNPFTENAKLNYKKLYEVSYEQQRLMDNLVDLEIEYIGKILDKLYSDPEPIEIKLTEINLWEKIRDTAESGRRTGSGITALADMLAALNIKYDSIRGLEVAESVMKTKMKAELDCTIDLAILRGSFKGWDWKKESGENANKFHKFIKDTFNLQYIKMLEYGRRNVSWSTIAPTGSVSILCQTSSGCEPIFQPFYMRRKKINPNDPDTRVDFTDDNGDKWQEYPVLHEKFKEWIYKFYNWDNESEGEIDFNYYITKQVNSKELQEMFKQSPWYKSTANDIDWEYRLKMQEVLQKYTSHSISSTLNLPEDTTEATVSKIYLEASKMNLKGITLYVEGSRSGVLVNTNNKAKIEDSDRFSQHNAPKRPKELSGEAHITSVKGQKFNVIVGFLEEKPYEVFAFPSKNLKGEGLVIKQGKASYDFIQLTESNSTHRVLTDCMNDEEAAITRLVSTGLRHGTKIDFIVEQLNKTNGDLTSFSKAIARILSKYVDTKEIGNCPECKVGKVIKQEGCESCSNCDYSKC